jgi:hypothetical protein
MLYEWLFGAPLVFSWQVAALFHSTQLLVKSARVQQAGGDIEPVFENANIFVASAEKGLDATRDLNAYFHSRIGPIRKHEGTAGKPEVPGSPQPAGPKIFIRERGGKANICA